MTKPSLVRELKTQIWILLSVLGVLWVIHGVNTVLFQGQLVLFGIRPRQIGGLWGILFAPLLHDNLSHLMANTVPLLTLGWLVMLQTTVDFLIVTAIAMGVSGLGTWLIGASTSVHVGASGVIFGYFGFLLLRGYFERSAIAIAISLLVMGFYGSLLWGVLPNQPGVSWEGHLFGFVGGAIAARLLSQRPTRQDYDS
ncbi:MAG: rhomboid family intramembrane serine protease [Leptolyngbyaceae cyanobacterium T60_A2020_046]|nr:rhomboid family intramembrane serine protease [Leptolyngbyaceae cyanobacterium T60_A2020_046]